MSDYVVFITHINKSYKLQQSIFLSHLKVLLVKKIKGPDVDPTQIVDTRVAIDGTWRKQGYSSLNGVVVATSAKGKMLDYQIFSKY